MKQLSILQERAARVNFQLTIANKKNTRILLARQLFINNQIRMCLLSLDKRGAIVTD